MYLSLHIYDILGRLVCDMYLCHAFILNLYVFVLSRLAKLFC